jgi:hypothetical protein
VRQQGDASDVDQISSSVPEAGATANVSDTGVVNTQSDGSADTDAPGGGAANATSNSPPE